MMIRNIFAACLLLTAASKLNAAENYVENYSAYYEGITVTQANYETSFMLHKNKKKITLPQGLLTAQSLGAKLYDNDTRVLIFTQNEAVLCDMTNDKIEYKRFTHKGISEAFLTRKNTELAVLYFIHKRNQGTQSEKIKNLPLFEQTN